MEGAVGEVVRSGQSGIKSPEKRPGNNAEIRRELARSMGNKYGARSLLVAELESHAEHPGLLVISHRRDAQGETQVRTLGEQEAGSYAESLTAKEMMDQLLRDARRYERSRQQPEGSRLLSKKLGHASALPKNRSGTDSRFAGIAENLASVRGSRVVAMQAAAEGLITDIMGNPGTIIINNETIRVVNDQGQGLTLVNIDDPGVRADPLLHGFVDTALYFQPERKARNGIGNGEQVNE